MESLVRRIIVDVVTSYAEDAGTTAPIFLGMGGREFRLSVSGAFDAGAESSIQLGEDANVSSPEHNDPRLDLALTVADVLNHPAYLRLHPRNERDGWKVERVSVRVHCEGERRGIRFEALERPGASLWLGLATGLVLRLGQADVSRLDLKS